MDPPRVVNEGVGGGGVRVSPAMANEAMKCVIAVTDLSFPAANLRSVRPRKEEQLRKEKCPGKKRGGGAGGGAGGGGGGAGGFIGCEEARVIGRCLIKR